jgi:hypothetical protein
VGFLKTLSNEVRIGGTSVSRKIFNRHLTGRQDFSDFEQSPRNLKVPFPVRSRDQIKQLGKKSIGWHLQKKGKSVTDGSSRMRNCLLLEPMQALGKSGDLSIRNNDVTNHTEDRILLAILLNDQGEDSRHPIDRPHGAQRSIRKRQ